MRPNLVCTSHSPLLFVRARKPDYEDEVFAKLEERRDAVTKFDPEVVFMFGSDHYAGFHFNAMPAFCIGRGTAQAVDDVGGFPGELSVDKDTGLGLLQWLRVEGFDPAQSLKMTVDHGFSQTMKHILGELDAYPTVPIFVSAMAIPFQPLRRSRELGSAVGRYAKSLGKRVLFLGSGGLSHHPIRYYPLIGEGSPEVEAWQIEGSAGGTFTNDGWFENLLVRHIESGRMIAQGLRTKEQMRLNPEVDRRFLAIVESGALHQLDDWKLDNLYEETGIGFTEIHTWIAAVSANLACGGTMPVVDFYRDALEYGIGFGIVHAN